MDIVIQMMIGVSHSVGEGIASIGEVGVGVWLSLLTFLLAVFALFVCVKAVRSALRCGERLFCRRTPITSPSRQATLS